MYATMRETAGLEAARALVTHRPGGGERTDTSLLEEQLCAEAGLWEPAVARRALHQSRGDIAHAVSMLRVWAVTQPHVAAAPVRPDDVVVLRRLSSAYPQIPGGQWLGAAPELMPRELDWSQPAPGDGPAAPEPPEQPPGPGPDAKPPTRAGTPRVRDLIDGVAMRRPPVDGDGADPATTVPAPPYPRAAVLALLARGETGALVALAALILGRRSEAVLVELTVGVAGVRVPHPRTGVPCLAAEVPVTEVEVVLDAEVDGRPGLATGWGASLGTVERRAIALALLDAAMQADRELREPLLLDPQTVLAATDGPATNGFVEHLRLPHYAGFTAYLARAVPDPTTPMTESRMREAP